MIIGTYLVDMPHIRKTSRNPRFIARFYSPQEMKFLMEKHFPKNLIADMFCTKAAFAKAMGMSFKGCKLSEVSVLTDYSGAYYISLSGNAKKQFSAKKMRTCVSCSHTKASAMSTVLFYE